MPRRPDKAKIRYAENCIASGMLDGGAARHIAEHFGIALSTAYDYLNLAYQEVAQTVKTDTARKKGRIEAMISQAAMRSLKANKIREFLKSVELLMRLQGLDKLRLDIQNTDGMAELQAKIQAQLASQTPAASSDDEDEDD